MKRSLISVAVLGLVAFGLVGCGGDDRAASQAAATDRPAASAAVSTGSVTAQPEADDPDTTFEVRAAALGRSYFGFHILLSDHPDETVGTSGKWARLPSELEPPYHRLAMTLAELPSTPGEVAATRLEYSLHDAEAGPFNYGWTALEGRVVIAAIEGLTEVKEGLVPGASLSGHFDLTNNRGGHFTGSFRIVP